MLKQTHHQWQTNNAAKFDKKAASPFFQGPQR
jgi:hypothetical protein